MTGIFTKRIWQPYSVHLQNILSLSFWCCASAINIVVTLKSQCKQHVERFVCSLFKTATFSLAENVCN